MANPFEKRATEFLRDDSAFLSVVTPEPLYTFFGRPAKDGTLYDRLCMVIGTPGSGKTTIATLLQLRIVETLLNSPNIEGNETLKHALAQCGFIKNETIKVLGCRLPLESEYREFWELPYKDEIKFGLLKSFIQARAIISWMKNLEANARYNLEDIKIVYRDGCEAAAEKIGGECAKNVFEKAKIIERFIYDIGAALIPPHENSLKDEVIAPYHPFDAIESIRITKSSEPSIYKDLKPLVMLDDAHTLHPTQLVAVRNWLARREMKIARWLLMRLDPQTPKEVIDSFASDSRAERESGINKSREITNIWLQSGKNRRKQREAFREMAKSMANKYLRLMPIFTRQGISKFSDILNTNIKEIASSNIDDLTKKINKIQIEKHISNQRRKEMEDEINRYLENSESIDKGRDIRLAMLRIMFHRYVNRVSQESLFNLIQEDAGPKPSKPIRANAGLADGAKIFLMHNYGRPYYFGIEAVCDGSSENAELFLRLASILVEAAETRIIKSPNSNAGISPQSQHKFLIDRAKKIIDDWAFPFCEEVRRLCTYIAKQCIEKSLEPNASLAGGANAFGIPQEEFDTISTIKDPNIAEIIKFGVAYNAISLKPQSVVKKKEWCLIELSGPVLIANGLTLKRGGFLERRVSDLLRALEG